MSAEEVRKRLIKIRKSLDTQMKMREYGHIALSQTDAEIVILLIDTVIRWDYDI